MDAAEYERITVDYTEAAARALTEVNPEMTFAYISGAGTDSTESGRFRWARAKGRAENLVIAAFPNGYGLRPGFVRPVHGKKPRNTAFRVFTTVVAPISPVLQRLLPGLVISTAQIGQAALGLARHGFPRRVLENRDMLEIASAAREED
ncbi:hypothetical protein P3H15_32255 [Rhodococcus sp. T2V]|uniref:hypothetical protein n=1 Tax=Rhodococcus sp. T2V TaxID=3034164 RepID=UPI0023E33961|nr:hypothetical protein [Rhodococcus sp. T2V]MDF3309693.1 hypothetical protein [Rhodococcus sp. T2V]